MKIGILTLPLHTNYGGILQCYALQTVLERMNNEIVVFNSPIYTETPSLKEYAKRIIKKMLGRKVGVFYEVRRNREQPIIRQHTQPFIDKRIHTKVIEDVNELNKNDYDAIVVGSDQIWRPMYIRRPIRSTADAYLKFAENWNIKKIAYAASFGSDEWEYSSEETEECKRLIKLFDAVSVREESAIKLCEENLSYSDAIQVLDPTMLLDAEDYKKIFSEYSSPEKSSDTGKLLVYYLDSTPEKMQFAEKLSEKLNLPIKKTGSNVENTEEDIKNRIQPPVEEWLRSLYNAEFVLTDSFHGCVFSILFKKPFYVIGNAKRGMARFSSLLKMFDLENRFVAEDSSNFDIDTTEIAYDKVYSLLDDWRKRSMDYLSQHFS